MRTKLPLSVSLGQRELADGKVQLYLDIRKDGKRSREATGCVLLPGKSREVKAKNEETMLLAQEIRKNKYESMQRSMMGIEEDGTGYLMPFFEYFEHCMEKYDNHTVYMWRSTLSHLKVYEKNHDILFADITKDWLCGFVDYLEHDAVTLRKPTAGDTEWAKKHPWNGPKKISQNTAAAFWQKVVCCLNYAVSDNLIVKNPANGVKGLSKKECNREYLTDDEVKLLYRTKTNSNVRRSFLFCCFTGLRYSDVYSLTWGDLETNSDGMLEIVKRQQKTERFVRVPINGAAQSLLGDRGGNEDRVFPEMPMSTVCNRMLKNWVKRAGIDKHITFHSSRHTFATLLLTNDVDIYTASKLLGHTDVKTTQIYAKIIDKKRKRAVDAIDMEL